MKLYWLRGLEELLTTVVQRDRVRLTKDVRLCDVLEAADGCDVSRYAGEE
jgi:hypothetical protein